MPLAEMEIENACETLVCVLSVTLIVRVNVPAEVGVPLSTPLLERLSPAGKLLPLQL